MQKLMSEETDLSIWFRSRGLKWELGSFLTELRYYVYRTKGHSEQETCKASAFAEGNQTDFTWQYGRLE